MYTVSSLIGQGGLVKTNDGVGASSKSKVGVALPGNGETTDKMLLPLDGEDCASAGVIKGSSVGVLTLVVLMLPAAAFLCTIPDQTLGAIG